MALGIRYPKAHSQGHIRSTASGTNNPGMTALLSGKYARLAGTAPFLLNPKRYSEVRKVVFWMCGTLLDSTPPSITARLRIAMSSATGDKSAPSVATIAPGSAVRIRGPASIFPNEPSTEAEIYDHAGDYLACSSISTFADRTSTLWTIEFDRFEPGHEDFFNAWDELAANNLDDEYCLIHPIMEASAGGDDWSVGSATSTFVFYECGVSVVQAPSTINRTSTIINTNTGWISYGAEATTFGTPRAWPFRYLEDDWDNVTSMHVWSFLPSSGGAGTWNMELEVGAMQHEGGAITSTSRYNESFSDSIGVSNVDAVHRSLNILSSIQDGDFIGIEWRKLVATAVGQPTGYIEVIQEGFTKTVCPHVGSVSGPQSVTEITEPEQYGYGKAFFDPTWYQSFPEDRVLSSRFWSGLKHSSAAYDPTQKVVINANEQADWATSPFNIALTPENTATPVANIGYKLKDEQLTGQDPRLLAGTRILGWRMNAAVWNGGQPGGNFVVYALSVPDSEFIGFGPLFELGAFNPEGCASTAAGLGDPGKLVITNGSTIPKKFDPVAGTISNCGIQPPFCDEVPATLVEDDAASPDGGLSTGIYVYRYTLRNSCTGHESDPNDTDIEVDTTGASPAAKVTISFAGVRIPGDDQVDQICIYRTVAGGVYPVMAKVGCIDISAGESSFVDSVGDSVLDFTNEGLSLLNGPMPCVPIVVEFRNFLFGMGDIPILSPAGTVTVVEGSDIVEGSLDVEWDRCLINKFIQVQGDCRRYEIKCVLPPAAGLSPPIQRLQLYEPYEGTSDTGLLYTICGRPNRLYNSEPLEPESWPAISFIDVEPGDGDRLMGAVSNFDRLVICKRRKTYVLTFRSTPAAEVIVPARISSDIGCIAPRSFAQVESGSVWLADRGLAIYDGRGVSHVPASEQMNDIFTDPNNARYVRRDSQGRVVDAVGVFYPKREQYLLILPSVRSNRGCDMMLVWDVKLQNVTLLEFCQEFQSMVVGKDSEGNQRVYLGDTNGFVWMFDIGLTDGVGYPNATGTVRGTITAAGTTADGVSYIDDDEASFLLGGLPELAGLSGVAGLSGAFGGLSPQENDLGLAGVCVHWRAADADKDDDWDSMFVFAASESRLYLAVPFSDNTPSVGDDYMLGPIRFDCTFKPANMGTDDFMKRNWRQVLTHVPQDRSGKLRVELRPDFLPMDPEEDTVVNDVGEVGDGRVFDVAYSKGRQQKPVGILVHNFQQIRFTNFAPDEPIQIINHHMMVEARGSR